MQTKSISRIIKWLLLPSVLILMHGCSEKRTALKYPVHDFTKQLFDAGADSLSLNEFLALQKEHGRFFDRWLYEIADFVKYGPLSNEQKVFLLNDFIRHNKKVYTAVKANYARFPHLNEDINKAITKLNELVGPIKNPVIYTYFSEFSNYTTFIDSFQGKTVFAYSQEMFMNDTFLLYRRIELPTFFNRYNGTSQIPAMLVWNYLKSLNDDGETGKTMLAEAVLNGKIWYTMQRVFPDIKPWTLYGYTKQEWEQLMAREGQIWRHYIDENVIFSTDFNKYKRYFIYGDHTFGVTSDEKIPPLLGNFTGLRIIQAYADKEGDDLKKLWSEKDADKIFRSSGYNPIR